MFEKNENNLKRGEGWRTLTHLKCHQLCFNDFVLSIRNRLSDTFVFPGLAKLLVEFVRKLWRSLIKILRPDKSFMTALICTFGVSITHRVNF